MRAVTVIGQEGEQRLALVDHAPPAPGTTEIIVAVKAISLNNGEVRETLAGAAGYRPGWDFAGVVEVAPSGSDFEPGDRVVGLKFEGAWAERVAVAQGFLAKIPDHVTFQSAAILPVAGLTASLALSKKPLKPGSKVLVTAATGGVGMIAVQLAAATGAQVTVFLRNEQDAGLMRELGASSVAVGHAQAAQLGPYDLILEGVGGALLGQLLPCLAPRGVCVQFGDASGDELTTFDAKAFRLGPGGLFGGTSLYGFFLAEELTRPQPAMAGALLADLATRLANGKLTPMIGQTGSWRDVDAIARSLLSRDYKGKAVLHID